MIFGNPAFLYALPVVFVPVIIHFLKLYRTTTFYYSRVEDIKRLKKDQKKVKQLRDLLTLLLRSLAILCLVLAFAKPSFTTNDKNDTLNNKALHFVIDNSPSNDLGNNKGLSAYKTALINTLDNLPEEQSIALTTADEVWENELIGDAIKKVSGLGASNKAFETIALADSNVSMIIFSDFQSEEWSDFEASNVRYYSDKPIESNVAIDTAYIVNNQLSRTLSDLIIRFKRSDASAAKTSLRVMANDETIVTKIIDFGEEFWLTDTIKVKNDSVKYLNLTVSLDDTKGFLHDNTFFVSLAPSKNIKVLVYGPSDSNKVFQKLLGRDNDYEYQYLKQGVDNFTDVDYSNLLIVSGINYLDANLKAELQRLKSEGGSCLMFPGKEIDASYNSFLEAFNLKLEAQKSEDNQLLSFRFHHPYFKDVFDQVPNEPSLPIVTDAYIIQGAPGYTELISGLYGSLAVQFAKKDFQLILTGIPFAEGYSGTNFFNHALFVPFSFKALEQGAWNNNPLVLIGDRLFSQSNHTGQAKLMAQNKLITELPWQKQFGKSFLDLEGITLKPGFYTLITDEGSTVFAINAPRTESNLSFENLSSLSSKGFEEVDLTSGYMAHSALDFENNDGYLFFALVFIFLLLESIINKFLTHDRKAIQRG